jgi:AmmeMemoRadiSam system protein A
MSQPVTFQLTEDDQQLLLRIARNAVRSYLSGQAPRFSEMPVGPLSQVHGVFVSIHQNGDLRGCIGNIHAVSPLYRTVAECAIAAAVGDPRFMPLMAAQLPSVDFEVSVLSPLHRVLDIEEIEVGKHGLVVSKKNARALLLPQVATTYGWDREQLLEETCRKAGLRADDWKQDATIESFSAVIFSEKQFDMPCRAADYADDADGIQVSPSAESVQSAAKIS